MGLLSGALKRYGRKQARDLALFVVLALLEKPKLADDPEALAELAVAYILTHGSPSEESVREFLNT